MGKQTVIFLERNRYRTRRLVDGLRLLPVLAAILWVVPAIWTHDSQNPPGIAQVAIYFFATWAGMIALCLILARRLSHSAEFWSDSQTAPQDRG